MLEIKNLTKVYKTKNGAETVALSGVSLKFGAWCSFWASRAAARARF